MKTFYSTATAFVILTCFLIGTSFVQAQDIQPEHSRDEVKFWKNKAKGYVKNPMMLKSEFENYQNQIKDLKQRNKELSERVAQLEAQVGGEGAQMASAGGASAQMLVDSLRWSIVQLKGQLGTKENEYERLLAEYKSRNKVNDMGLKPGLVYGIQIGAYVFYEMPNPPVNMDDVVVERADGYNKYVIGNFRTYEEATHYKKEFRRIGIKDAWIVPYIDGVRVTIQEANRHLKNQGNY